MAEGKVDFFINLRLIAQGQQELAQVLEDSKQKSKEAAKAMQDAYGTSGAIKANKEAEKHLQVLGKQADEYKRLEKRVNELRNLRSKTNNPKEIIAYNKQIRASKKELKSLTKEANVGKGAFNDFLSQFGGRFGAAFQRINTQGKQAIQGLVRGFGTLKLAIASTGIGLLLLALGSLVSFFTKTQRGADLLKQATAGLGAVIDVLVDRASALGENIFKAFSNPKQAAKDFAQFIKDNIQFRFEQILESVGFLGDAFVKLFQGKFKAALSDAGNSFKALGQSVTGVDFDAAAESVSGLTEEITKEAAAAARLEAANQRLLDKEIGFITSKARLRTQIEENRLAAEDETLSYQERIKALQDAEAAQDKITRKEIAFQTQRANIIREQVALGESMREDLRNAAEAEARVIELNGERARAVKRLTTRLNALRKEQLAAENAAKKQVKAITDAYNDIAKNLTLEADIEPNVPDNIEPIELPIDASMNGLQAIESALQGAFNDIDLGGLSDAERQIVTLIKRLDDLGINLESVSNFGRMAFDAYTSGINEALNKNDEFIAGLDETIDGLKAQLDEENQLAEKGFANDKTRIEQELAFQQEQREKAIAQQEQIVERQRKLDNISKNASIGVAVARMLAESAKLGPIGLIGAAAGITALLSLLQNSVEKANTISLFDGTENTGRGGNVDSKGGFHAILHPNERVVPAKDNKFLKGIKNSELPKMAEFYKNFQPLAMNWEYLNGLSGGSKLDTTPLEKAISKQTKALLGRKSPQNETVVVVNGKRRVTRGNTTRIYG